MKSSWDADQVKSGDAIPPMIPVVLDIVTEGSRIYCSHCKNDIFPGKIYYTVAHHFQEKYGGVVCQRCVVVFASIKPR